MCLRLAWSSAGSWCKSSALCSASSFLQSMKHLPTPISASGASFTTDASASSEKKQHLVVFGGRGFVGSHIIQEALRHGLHVVSVSRSGTPPAQLEPWMQQVEWVRGNALEPLSYRQVLQGAQAAISAVGGFGNQQQMLQTNGTANATAIEAAAGAGVPRFVYVSAHIPNVPGIEVLLKGYVAGKRMAEDALTQFYPKGGVALRPGIIYGNRVVSSQLTLPLQYFFQPLEKLIHRTPQAKQWSSMPLAGALLTPPVDVKVVAQTAVRAATDSSFPAGTVDIWQLAETK